MEKPRPYVRRPLTDVYHWLELFHRPQFQGAEKPSHLLATHFPGNGNQQSRTGDNLPVER